MTELNETTKPFIDYRVAWKKLAKDKKATSRDVIQRCICKAIKAKSEDKVELLHYFLSAAFKPSKKSYYKYLALALWRTTSCHILGSMVKPKTGNGEKFLLKPLLLGVNPDLILTEEEQFLFEELRKSINRDKLRGDDYYTYIYVRQDITKEQQAVQAAHAVYVAGSKLGKHINPSKVNFVLIGLADISVLNYQIDKLSKSRYSFSQFHEPAMGNQLTAIATEPIPWNKRSMFKGPVTLKFDNNIKDYGIF